MALTRRILSAAWLGYGMLWLAALTSQRWAPSDAGILVVAGFGFGLLFSGGALSVAVLMGAFTLRSDPSTRTAGNITLVVLSVIGLAAQSAYLWFFLVG